jgi:hypothetical protein
VAITTIFIAAVEAARIWERLSNDDSVCWAVIGAEGSAGKPRAVVNAIGDTDLAGMKTCLKDDDVQFVLMRAKGVDNAGGTRTKLIFVHWAGAAVSRMKKAQSQMLKSVSGGVSGTSGRRRPR